LEIDFFYKDLMQIKKTYLPLNSTLKNTTYHYVDCYSGLYSDPENKISITDIGKAFFTSSPRWINNLLKVRDKIVNYFGLKISKIDENELLIKLHSFSFKSGEQIGLFKVIDKTDFELILGEDDKHLNFRISLLINNSSESFKKELILSTSVLYNNNFGKIYFYTIKPFHRIIVPVMLKRVMVQKIVGGN